MIPTVYENAAGCQKEKIEGKRMDPMEEKDDPNDIRITYPVECRLLQGLTRFCCIRCCNGHPIMLPLASPDEKIQSMKVLSGV